MKQVYLYGAGGHAKVILDILKSNGIIVPEIFDDNPNIHSFMEIPVVHENIRFPLIISIGNNNTRKMIAERLGNAAFSPAVTAKPAIVSDSAEMGEGTIVMQGAIIQSSVKIGKHAIINTGATIDHDCRISDFAHVAPGCNLCGNVTIGEGTLVGAGTIIIPGIRVGKWSVISAGSVVTKDIPDGVLAAGNRCKTVRMINKYP